MPKNLSLVAPEAWEDPADDANAAWRCVPTRVLDLESRVRQLETLLGHVVQAPQEIVQEVPPVQEEVVQTPDLDFEAVDASLTEFLLFGKISPDRIEDVALPEIRPSSETCQDKCEEPSPPPPLPTSPYRLPPLPTTPSSPPPFPASPSSPPSFSASPNSPPPLPTPQSSPPQLPASPYSPHAFQASPDNSRAFPTSPPPYIPTPIPSLETTCTPLLETMSVDAAPVRTPSPADTPTLESTVQVSDMVRVAWFPGRDRHGRKQSRPVRLQRKQVKNGWRTICALTLEEIHRLREIDL